MKKLLLSAVLFSGMAFGQFTVTESSNDWKKLGSYWGDATSLLTNGDKVMLRYEDIRSRSARVDTFGAFKSQSQQNVDKLERAIENGNNGIKSKNYEFIFSAPNDTMEKLYNIILTHFKEKKTEELTLNFPEGNLFLNFNKYSGMMSVSIGSEQNGDKIYSMPITLGGVKKVFGKN